MALSWAFLTKSLASWAFSSSVRLGSEGYGAAIEISETEAGTNIVLAIGSASLFVDL